MKVKLNLGKNMAKGNSRQQKEMFMMGIDTKIWKKAKERKTKQMELLLRELMIMMLAKEKELISGQMDNVM